MITHGDLAVDLAFPLDDRADAADVSAARMLS